MATEDRGRKAARTLGTAREYARPTSNGQGFCLYRIAAFEILQVVVVGYLFRQRINYFQAAGQLSEFKSDVEQPGHPAPTHHRMRLPLPIPLHRLMTSYHTHPQLRQLQIHLPLDSSRWQTRQLIPDRRGTRIHAIGPGYIRLPGGHPTPEFCTVLRLPIPHGGIKEGRGQPGQPTMGTDGTSEGGKRLRQVIRPTPATAQHRPVQATKRAAQGDAPNPTVCPMSGHQCFSLPDPWPIGVSG